jgi:predicted transport protein
MPKSPMEMRAAITRNLAAKTGKTWEEWVELVRREGSGARKEQVEWLKQVYGLGHVTAALIVEEALRPADHAEPTDEELVEAQYAGEKAKLRPIYDRVMAAVQSLGPDVEIGVRQTYVAFSRGRQFGLIQASTKSRVDLMFTLPGVEPTDRLKPAGSAGSGRTTHKVALTSPDEVDSEVLGWLRQAYESALSR